jgi:hypothetical protein
LYHEQENGGDWQKACEVETIFLVESLQSTDVIPGTVGKILHVVSKKYGSLYVGKQMADIHITGTLYTMMEFLTFQTFSFFPPLSSLPSLTVSCFHVLGCD